MESESLLRAEDLRLLVEIGFMAVSRGDHRTAAAVFAGMVAARPADQAGHIGRALLHLDRNEPARAVAILRALPPSDPVRLFLGLAFSRQGDIGQARAVLADLAVTAAGTPPGEDARRMLESLPS